MQAAIKFSGNVVISEEVKKKESTPEPVKESIPFLTDKAETYKTSPPQPAHRNSSIKSKSKPTVKINAPSAGGSLKMPSLNDLKKNVTQAAEEKAVTAKAIVEYDTIDKNSFGVAFRKYMDGLLQQKKFNIHDALQTYPPEIIDNKRVEIVFGSQAFYNFLEPERDHLTTFLKTEMDIHSIDLMLKVDKTRARNDVAKKPYTAQEKYEFLLQKNPPSLKT